MKTIFRRVLFLALVPLVVFAVTGATGLRGEPDLVLVESSGRELLQEHELPVIWKGAGFFIARDLVLTAAHVAGAIDTEVIVTPPGSNWME